MNFEQKLTVALNKAHMILQAASPYDTGNLRYNAIKLESIGKNEWKLYIDENIAPYAKYTNEPWIKPRGKYKQNVPHNPNEGWFDEEIRYILLYLEIMLNGKLTETGGGE